MELKIKKFSETATMPFYATEGSAAFDLTVDRRDILPQGQVKVYFGVGFEIPQGYVGVIAPRSSVCKTAFILANSIGIIDSDYRDEVSAVFDIVRNGHQYEVGERAAQMMIMPFSQCNLVEVNELNETKRGTGGYGSTGR
jgi:dUTP pyrophosphatase